MSKILTVFCLSTLLSYSSQNHSYFILQEVSCGVLGHENIGKEIVFNDSATDLCPYNPIVYTNYSESEVLKMISELLKFEGNTDFYALKIRTYSPLKSQVYTKANKVYSIQLEALFIINLISMSNPFYYSSHPLLYDKKNGIHVNGVEDEIMDQVYDLNIKWFEKDSWVRKEVATRSAAFAMLRQRLLERVKQRQREICNSSSGTIKCLQRSAL